MARNTRAKNGAESDSLGHWPFVFFDHFQLSGPSPVPSTPPARVPVALASRPPSDGTRMAISAWKAVLWCLGRDDNSKIGVGGCCLGEHFCS